MSALETPRTSRAISRSPMSPCEITSVGAFLSGMTYESLIHKLGCLKPHTTRDVLDVATNHASSEEVVRAVFNGGWDKGKAKRTD